MAEDADREARTPKTTGSFAIFHSEAKRIAGRFTDIATRKLHGPLEARDREGAAFAELAADELATMARQFASWPEMSEEAVAAQRPLLTARLIDLNRQCEEMAAGTPGMPPARR